MYLAAIAMYLAAPIALGSYWALLQAMVLPLVLVARIRDEERLLVEELPGYREYTAKTRSRLIPGLW
jgi:protein-S-isoprenylcysteine O-methyltransferase Ste14